MRGWVGRQTDAQTQTLEDVQKAVKLKTVSSAEWPPDS